MNVRDKIKHVSIRDIRPSPENASLYRAFDVSNDDDASTLASIRKNGILTPLVISEDGFILDGHRRYDASIALGLEMIPARVRDVRHDQSTTDDWLALLLPYNSHREKTTDEILRESIVAISPEDAHRELVRYRASKSKTSAEVREIEGEQCRAEISPAKKLFLDAIKKVLDNLEGYRPVTLRTIHYELLNDPPLMHASKPDSVYVNELKSYQSLSNLLNRAKLAGLIPWSWIADNTRSIATWNIHDGPGSFIRNELDAFLKNYYRDLMQSQENHFEIVCEKLPPVIRDVAAYYTIPLTSGGGYPSGLPVYKMVQRFNKSGKNKLVLICLSDFDPDGEEIGYCWARNLRDDFGIQNIEYIKALLTSEQVVELNLIPKMTVNEKSSRNKKKFTDKNGENVWELSAVSPPKMESVSLFL